MRNSEGRDVEYFFSLYRRSSDFRKPDRLGKNEFLAVSEEDYLMSYKRDIWLVCCKRL